MTWLLLAWLCTQPGRWGECAPARDIGTFETLGDCRRARHLLQRHDGRLILFCRRADRAP